jgi:hypothetical protein
MADVAAHTPIFSRGSTVLDYWLAHAEGLTVQPIGARVEEVVATGPVGRTETLIVRSRVTRRRRKIPAASIAAVEPSLGHLLLDEEEPAAAPRIPRPSPERLDAVRERAGETARRGGRVARAHAVEAARLTNTGSRSAISWLRPRAVRAGAAAVRHGRLAAARTGAGIAWLAPRVVAGARTVGATCARLALAAAVIVARAAARAGRGVERAAVSSAKQGRASLEARRALQQARRAQRGPDD